jgi:hypothetical protein
MPREWKTRTIYPMSIGRHRNLLQLFGLAATIHSGYMRLMPAMLTAGVGVPLALPHRRLGRPRRRRPTEAGMASGTANTLQRFGAAFGLAVATTVSPPPPGTGRSSAAIEPMPGIVGYAQGVLRDAG